MSACDGQSPAEGLHTLFPQLLVTLPSTHRQSLISNPRRHPHTLCKMRAVMSPQRGPLIPHTSSSSSEPVQPQLSCNGAGGQWKSLSWWEHRGVCVEDNDALVLGEPWGLACSPSAPPPTSRSHSRTHPLRTSSESDPGVLQAVRGEGFWA